MTHVFHSCATSALAAMISIHSASLCSSSSRIRRSMGMGARPASSVRYRPRFETTESVPPRASASGGTNTFCAWRIMACARGMAMAATCEMAHSRGTAHSMSPLLKSRAANTPSPTAARSAAPAFMVASAAFSAVSSARVLVRASSPSRPMAPRPFIHAMQSFCSALYRAAVPGCGESTAAALALLARADMVVLSCCCCRVMVRRCAVLVWEAR